MTLDDIRAQATVHRIDWNDHRRDYYNWREFVGPQVRAIWHTLTDEQKVAIASDAYEFAVVKTDHTCM